MRANIGKELTKITDDLNIMAKGCSSRIGALDPANSKKTHQKANVNDGQLRAKTFVPRESRLTVLLQIQDFVTVYNIFVSILPILGLTMVLQNYAEKGNFIDFSLMIFTFGKPHLTFLGWTILLGATLVGYFWKFAYKALPFPVLVALYVTYQSCLALFAGYYTLFNQLPPASALIIMCEQTRLSMKIHSFFRTHLPTNNKPAEEVYQQLEEQGPKLSEAGFSEFLYFIACPSIIYRTSYPRTPLVQWSKVVSHALECVFIVLYIYIVFTRFLFPIIRVPPTPGEDTLWDFVLMSFNAMLPSIMIFVFGFFGFLHSWMNFWAELLQFADREFYRDWWNSLSFAEYYRKWNGVVYDWLYAYVYSDVVLFLEKHGFKKLAARSLSSLFVIEASAVIHEFIIACAFGFFFPVLLLMFGGPGVLFTHFTRKRKDQNIFVWAMLFIGFGLMITLYSREYYFRQLYLEPRPIDWVYINQFFTSYTWRNLIEMFNLI